jgi:hypothetical protein
MGFSEVPGSWKMNPMRAPCTLRSNRGVAPTIWTSANGTASSVETSGKAYFIVPDKTSDKINIILEVKDDGNPIMKTYKRLIIEVEN